jgi:O-antigen/teichoic acid export membrane protein
MTTAPARGEHGAAEAAQPSARGASTRPPPAAAAELTPGDRSDPPPADDDSTAGDGYQPVNLSDNTLELAVNFVLGPAATGGHQDRPNPGAGGFGPAGEPEDDGAAGPRAAIGKAKRAGGLLRRGFGRLGWGVADQGVSSVTNAAISLYAARALIPADFGAFSLAYVTYAFALNASRGLATDPLMVRFSGTDRATWRRAVAGSTATALVVGVVLGACVLGVAMAMGGTARLAFFALGLTLPGLMLQDSWRYSFFAHGRGSQAFLSDTIWALAMLPELYLIRHTHHQNVFWFVLCWGAAAGLAAAIGPVQAWVIPNLSAVPKWVSRHRDLGPRYLMENTANSGAAQLRSYGLGLITGLAAVGYVQGATTLMGPFMVVFMGMSLVTVPEAARVLRNSPRRLPLFCLVVAVGLTLAALAWGGLLLIALPRGLGHLLLPTLWKQAYPIVLPTTLGLAGATCIAGASAGLRAMGASKRSLRTQVIASALYVVAALAGAAEGGAVGAVRGTAAAVWAGALLWWWQLHRALRESDKVPDGQGLWASRPAGRHHTTLTAQSESIAQPHSSNPPGAIHPMGES